MKTSIRLTGIAIILIAFIFLNGCSSSNADKFEKAEKNEKTDKFETMELLEQSGGGPKPGSDTLNNPLRNFIRHPEDMSDPKTWKCFKIVNAQITEDLLFYDLQMEANPGLLNKDLMTVIPMVIVDVRSMKPIDDLIFIGNRNSRLTFSYTTDIFSDEIVNKLLEYCDSNKIRIKDDIELNDIFFREDSADPVSWHRFKITRFFIFFRKICLRTSRKKILCR